MIIQSDRLELIPFDATLLTQDVMSWFANQELMKYYTNSKKSIEFDSLVDSIHAGMKSQTSYTHFIINKDSKKVIGTVKVGPINLAHQISDLVVLVGTNDNLGKGVGTEAISLGIELAFKKYKIRKLFGGMYAKNIASIKAYTRAGWIVEGILTGHYLENGENQDRILVGCFNPEYFSEEVIENAKYLKWYENQQ